MLIIVSIMAFLLQNCQISNQQNINPEMAKFEGKWHLVKIGGGFPAPGFPSEIKPTYEEILNFDTSKNTFTRTKEGKIIENSTIKVTKINEFSTTTRDAIIFEKNNMYSYYSFTENPLTLILYQASPIGAILADGNSYFYEKMK